MTFQILHIYCCRALLDSAKSFQYFDILEIWLDIRSKSKIDTFLNMKNGTSSKNHKRLFNISEEVQKSIVKPRIKRQTQNDKSITQKCLNFTQTRKRNRRTSAGILNLTKVVDISKISKSDVSIKRCSSMIIIVI